MPGFKIEHCALNIVRYILNGKTGNETKKM